MRTRYHWNRLVEGTVASRVRDCPCISSFPACARVVTQARDAIVALKALHCCIAVFCVPQEWLGDEDPESDLSDVEEGDEDDDEDDEEGSDDDEEGEEGEGRGGRRRGKGGDSDDDSEDSDNEPVTKEERDLFSMSLRDRQK